MISTGIGVKKPGRPPGRPPKTAKVEHEPRVPIRPGLAQGFNPATGGLRSGLKERRAAGQKARKAISASAALTTCSREHSESSAYEGSEEEEVMTH